MEMLSDEKFRVAFVLSLLQDDLLSSTKRSAALTPGQKLSIFMDVFGSASIQRSILQRKTHGYSQATVSRDIAEVSDVIYNRRDEFIFSPDENRLAETRRLFFEKCGIPDAVGALDGTHVKIIAPVEDEDSYVNRCSERSESTENREKEGIILADSAYGAESFLLKPILPPNRAPAVKEERYTNAVYSGRSVVERSIGAFKRQFFMLHNELRYEPERSAKVIIACCALRNVCIELNEPEFRLQGPVEEEEEDDFYVLDTEAPRDSAAGAAMRQHIIDTYFT